MPARRLVESVEGLRVRRTSGRRRSGVELVVVAAGVQRIGAVAVAGTVVAVEALAVVAGVLDADSCRAP